MKKTILSLFVVIGLLQADYIRDDSKGVVVDTSTNLMWQDDVASVQKTWIEAISYCENLTIASYDDWRLPNFNELYMLADRSKSNPAISPVFQNVVSDYYWSSTSVASYPDSAWDVYFNFGNDYWSYKDNSHYVRCVRAGQ